MSDRLDRLSKSPEGVLVRLKIRIEKALSINAETLRLLIDKYYSVYYGKAYSRSHTDKVNAFNEFVSDKMTVKVFFKFLRVIQVKKITIAVTVTTARDKEVTISDDFYMNVYEEAPVIFTNPVPPTRVVHPPQPSQPTHLTSPTLATPPTQPTPTTQAPSTNIPPGEHSHDQGS